MQLLMKKMCTYHHAKSYKIWSYRVVGNRVTSGRTNERTRVKLKVLSDFIRAHYVFYIFRCLNAGLGRGGFQEFCVTCLILVTEECIVIDLNDSHLTLQKNACSPFTELASALFILCVLEKSSK